MDALTEEQRRRVELSRLRALDKKNHAGNRNSKSWSQSHTATTSFLRNQNQNQPLNSGNGYQPADFRGVATADDMNMVSSKNNKPAHDNFGDSIDWGAAVGEVDRLLANSNSNTFQFKHESIRNTTAPNFMSNNQDRESKRQKMGYGNANANHQINKKSLGSNQPKSGLSEEQRARMEENKRKALEKKQKSITPPKPRPNMHNMHCQSQTSTGLSAYYSNDQLAYMDVEENRQKALETKQKAQSTTTTAMSSASAPTESAIHGHGQSPAIIYSNEQRAQSTTATTMSSSSAPMKSAIHGHGQSPAIIYSNEQRARMEENKRRALEKKQQMSHQSQLKSALSPKPTTIQDKSPKNAYSDEQRARIEENRRRALEKKQQATTTTAQLSSGGLSNTNAQCSSAPKSLHNEEQRARIEENRQRALEKKQQRLQTSQGPTSTVTQGVVAASKISDIPSMIDIRGLPAPTGVHHLSPKSYSDGQRARMEENRRRALEKKHQMLQHVTAPSALVLTCAQGLTATKSIQCPSHPKICSEEQRVRIEENKRKALEKRQQMSRVTAMSAPVLPPSAMQCPSPDAHNDEHRARMEENRRRALEKKRHKTEFSAAVASTLALPPSVTVTSTTHTSTSTMMIGEKTDLSRLGENGLKGLETKEQATAPSASAPVLPKSTTQSLPPNDCSDEQRARMEENQCMEPQEKGGKELKPLEASASAIPPSTKVTTNTFTSLAIAGGNIAQMGENAQKALERKEQATATSDSELPMNTALANMIKCPPPNIEESRRVALETKGQMLQPFASAASESALPHLENVATNTHPSTTVTDKKCTQMEEKGKKSLEDRKEQTVSRMSSKFALLQSDAPSESVLPASEMKSKDRLDIGSTSQTVHGNKEKDNPTKDDLGGVEESCHVALENQELVALTPPTDACIYDDDTNMNLLTQELAPSSPSEACLTPPKPAATETSPIKAVSAKKSGLPPIPQELQYEQSKVLPINDRDTDTLIENAELDTTLLNDWTLYDHQKEGVRRALRMRRLILAFDMGLGKTIIGCVWAKAFLKTFEGIKIFVIAPVSLQEDWKRTAAEATGLKVDTSDNKKKKKKAKPKKKKKKKDSGKTVTGKRKKIVEKIDSDSDDEDEEECQPPNNDFDLHVFSWNSIQKVKDVISGKGVSEYIVICDEAHSMQSITSKRTLAALKLVKPKKCRGVLLLSGTPMKNGQPSNLFPLLRAVEHPFGDNQKKYEFYFCNGQHKLRNGKNVWDATGSSNLKELNAHTTSHIFRLTKEECMGNELPPQKREFREIPVASLHEMRYKQALENLAKAYTSEQRYGSGGENDEILVSFGKLRQISSLAKVDAVVQLSHQIIQSESSIVIFTNFVAVAQSIYEQLEGMDWAGELLTGQTKKDKRQAMVDRFQSGLSPVFVCTYGAGSVGLTLTAACTVVLVDRPWTPGDVCQAEDRVRRIGQKRPVRSLWIKAFPIDEQIDQLLNHKKVNTSSVVDGKDNDGYAKSAPKVSISELVKSVLSNETGGE